MKINGKKVDSKTLNPNFSKFKVSFYDLHPISNVLSRARAKIFYQGENWNGTFIDDRVAAMLENSLPYVPIKGVFDGEDFQTHTIDRTEGSIYGVVPEWPNSSYENWIDEDGIGRNYLTTDVLLFTGLYKEAKDIVGKSLSMELYPDSLEGEYRTLPNGHTVLYLTFAEFSGLQVLGEDYMPCFEGAGFYTKGSVDELKENINKVWSTYSKNDVLGGLKMGEGKFSVSEEMQNNSLFSALNPKFTENDGYVVDYTILNCEEGKALVYSLSENKIMNCNYEEKEDNIEVNLSEYTAPKAITEDEQKLVDAVNEYELEVEGTMVDKFNKVISDFTVANEKIEQLEKANSEYESAKVELETENSTLKQEKENLQAEYEKLENASKELTEYKLNEEKLKKQNLINSYADKLDKEDIDNFSKNIDSYEISGLEKELAYTLVMSKPSLFNSGKDDSGLIPKDEKKNDLDALLDKYDR